MCPLCWNSRCYCTHREEVLALLILKLPTIPRHLIHFISKPWSISATWWNQWQGKGQRWHSQILGGIPQIPAWDLSAVPFHSCGILVSHLPLSTDVLRSGKQMKTATVVYTWRWTQLLPALFREKFQHTVQYNTTPVINRTVLIYIHK